MQRADVALVKEQKNAHVHIYKKIQEVFTLKKLVAYFSASGTTKKAAKTIAEALGCE